MALLNTAATRPSVVLLLLAQLARQRGKKQDAGMLIDTVSPPGISADGAHQSDARDCLRVAVELGIVEQSGDEVVLADDAVAPVERGQRAATALLREAVLAPRVNTGPWGSQAGARDLTNALAWYLTFSADAAPLTMEDGARSAMRLQRADFGSRQPGTAAGDTEEDGGGWPIGNSNRWQAFRFWACSLGFAWIDPNGHLMPDPTAAVRDALPALLSGSSELPGPAFIEQLGAAVPVLDTGPYRRFVQRNWQRPDPDERRLTPPLSDALDRLRSESVLAFEDRADAPRVTRADGATFSHVRRPAAA